MSDARTFFKGLRLPVPRAIQGQAQLLFATPMVVLHTLLSSPAVIVLGPLSPRAEEAVLSAWMRGVLLFSGVDLTVSGLENLDPRGRYVFVSNHQSLFDVPCVHTALPVPVRFVAKRSLANVPIFGPGMRAVGTVTIDRNDKTDTVRRLREARDSVGAKASIHFFAEGTRSQDGRLRTFKKGAAAMALSMQVPLVPLAVCGTRKIYPKGTFTGLRPGTAHVSIGKPITPGPADTPEERTRLTALARAAVRDLLAARGELVGDSEAEAVGGVVEEVPRGS
ncbi:MAG TPA: lysophospholipid acyltransferase family protein [Myxococcales bacterium]